MRADHPRRNRIVYACGVAIAVWLAIHSRRYEAILPDFIADYAPATLAAIAVFAAIGMVYRSLATWNAAAMAFILCALAEFSLLSRAPWIDAIRDTPAGVLAFGSDFVGTNLGCYAVGTLIGILIENLMLD
jgi:Protein of unknown function (DUF2809)